MNKFIISTDNTADLTNDFIKENNLDIHTLFYAFGDTVYGADNQLEPLEFYKKMRDGQMPTTMATNPDEAATLFRKRVSEGYDIIHIAFSSGLSGTYNNMLIARDMVLEEFPNARITVIDSLCASMGEGLLVYKAIQQMKAGKSYDEIVEYIENIKLNLSHQVTVDDLFHLLRGGRISKTTAIVGTLVGIKPIIHVNDEGKLISIGKVRGRKKALSELVDNMAISMGKFTSDNDIIYISHGDCLEDAQYVGNLITERFGITNIVYNLICPTIASHAGPGTVALFFLAEDRLASNVKH